MVEPDARDATVTPSRTTVIETAGLTRASASNAALVAGRSGCGIGSSVVVIVGATVVVVVVDVVLVVVVDVDVVPIVVVERAVLLVGAVVVVTTVGGVGVASGVEVVVSETVEAVSELGPQELAVIVRHNPVMASARVDAGRGRQVFTAAMVTVRQQASPVTSR